MSVTGHSCPTLSLCHILFLLTTRTLVLHSHIVTCFIRQFRLIYNSVHLETPVTPFTSFLLHHGPHPTSHGTVPTLLRPAPRAQHGQLHGGLFIRVETETGVGHGVTIRHVIARKLHALVLPVTRVARPLQVLGLPGHASPQGDAGGGARRAKAQVAPSAQVFDALVCGVATRARRAGQCGTGILRQWHAARELPAFRARGGSGSGSSKQRTRTPTHEPAQSASISASIPPPVAPTLPIPRGGPL